MNQVHLDSNTTAGSEYSLKNYKAQSSLYSNVQISVQYSVHLIWLWINTLNGRNQDSNQVVYISPL